MLQLKYRQAWSYLSRWSLRVTVIQNQVIMKVKIRSVLKSSSNDFQCFQDQQIIIKSGNMLCIKEIGKNQCEFLCLSKFVQHLYAFKPSNNKKGVFTAEKTQAGIQIAYYSLKGQRKSINLSSESSFFNETQKIDLLIDEYDNSLIYGSARNKEGNCVFLCDIGKGKVMALGYMAHFQDVKVDSRENMTLSICGHNGSHNYLKFLRYGLGQWEVEEHPYKKIHQGTVIFHELLYCGRVLFATKTVLYIFEEAEVLQTIQIPQDKKIRSILKIPKGILVLTEDHTIKLYIDDSDQITFVQKGDIPITLQADENIHKIHLSINNQQVIIRTTKNSLYIWKCEHISLDSGHYQNAFMRVETSCAGQKDGSISISTGKRSCMLSGSKLVTVWSLQRNEYVLSSQFTNAQSQKKSIITSAISPDGNSFILAFDDKIRIYKILLTKFKAFAQFPIKKCQNIIYSHGGQLVACRYGKGSNSCLQIINLLRLTQVNTIKIQSQPLQIIWNELDDEIVISSQNQSVQIFKIAQNIRLHHIKFDTPIAHVRIDYRVKKLLVSTENKITVIDGGDVIDQIVPSIENFHYAFPLYGIYFIATKTGVLYWSTSLRFETFGEYALFPQKTFQMICRNSYIVAYTSFQEIVTLEFIRSTPNVKKSNQNEVVMVQRDQILAFFEKVKVLESNFDMLLTGTQVKLEEERNNYEASVAKFKNQFNKQIKFINSKFSQLTVEKLKQQKQAQKIFDDLQHGQIRSVNDLQKMYNRKFSLERQKYMNLQQSSIEQKNKYQKIIYQLQSKHHRDILKVREEYARKYKEQSQRLQSIKTHNLQDKQKMAITLMDLEEQNEITLANIQQNKEVIIQNLQAHIAELSQSLKDLNIKYHNQETDLKMIESQKQTRDIQFRKLKASLEESMNRITLLEKEVRSCNAMVEDKNHVIKEQEHQISALEKAKYVLSFRTTEIRKELEPKQALADKLKSQMFKLNDQFKQQKKKTFELSQKIDKLQKINQITKKQNLQTKTQLKQKQRMHDQLCWQLFMIVNTLDQKEWNNSLVRIYQAYIKEDKFKNRQTRKKDDNSEEINRHLIHVEQSLFQISSGNNKNLKRKEEQIMKKMEENSLLLYQLNVMRKNQRHNDNEKKQMNIAMQRLKRELNQTYKSSNAISTRAHTAKTGITRRINASRDAISRQKSTLLDIQQFQLSHKSRSKDKSRNQPRSRISSANKTMLLRNQTRQQTNKFFEIAKELQTCRNTIKIQDEMIDELNKRVFGGIQQN